ncbi:MAG: ExeM/NucH family extracellular endonuclease [Gammaproteobacteria bacterium]
MNQRVYRSPPDLRPGRILLALLATVFACAMAQAAFADCGLSGLRSLHSLGDEASSTVRVQGIVTAVFPGLHGFFLEAPRSDWDGDPATSEAIFIYTSHHPFGFKAGDEVALAGTYSLFHGMPEIEHSRLLARCGVAPLPPAVAVRLPLTRPGGWPALLGMRVGFTQPLVVSNLEYFWRYGEAVITANARPLAPTQISVPGPQAIALVQRNQARSIWLDDGSTQPHPWVLELAGVHFDAAHPLRAGQVFSVLTGVAFHAFGHDLVEPTAFALDRTANPRRGPKDLGLPAGLRIVSFNVENYFNRALSGPVFPTERGARTPQDFACQSAKLVALLAALHPALMGLQEIENNGYGAHGALATLVDALNHAAPNASYRYVMPDVPRLGDDLIAPAIVYDARRLVPVGAPAVRYGPATGAAAVGLARPALAASFRERANGRNFTVAVVHLRSKLSTCGKRLDNFAGAGHCASARAAASADMSQWLANNPTDAPTQARFLIGDFNAYPQEAAIRTLTGAGWQDELARFLSDPAARYTESFHVWAGTLDYVFADPDAAKLVSGASVWHVDADEAREFDYAHRPLCHGPGAPYRASDHDPVIVVLKP